jgi:hypothetical protein
MTNIRNYLMVETLRVTFLQLMNVAVVYVIC